MINIDDIDIWIGDEIQKKCPVCKSKLLANQVGDKWCGSEICGWANSQELIDFWVHLGGSRLPEPPA